MRGAPVLLKVGGLACVRGTYKRLTVLAGLSRLCHYEAYIRTQVVEPLSIQPTGFLPDQSLWVNIAPTWNDTEYRHRVVQGQVSDGNSYASGGIAGHAGLFRYMRRVCCAVSGSFTGVCLGSSAGVLASFMTALLEAPTSAADTQFLTAATVAEFTTAVNLSQSSRALGWDTNSYEANTYRGCADLSEKTFTHTGFTGAFMHACVPLLRGDDAGLCLCLCQARKCAEIRRGRWRRCYSPIACTRRNSASSAAFMLHARRSTQLCVRS